MFASVNGIKLFFDVEGLQYVPDGPRMREKPVCFVLHGGPGGDHCNFLPETSVLAETMQLIYVDDRNCGRSERCDISTSSLKQNAADLEALRQYLGLDKIYILGHSYGGMKAQQYMIDYPEHLHGVILAGTAGESGLFQTAEAIVMERGTEAQKALWKRRMNEFVPYEEFIIGMGSMYHYHYDEVEARNGTLRCIKNSEVRDYQAPEMRELDLISHLHDVKFPVLILCGKYDHITAPIYSEHLHEAIPNSELHIIDECAHEMFSDRPDFVFPCIVDFVGRTFSSEAE